MKIAKLIAALLLIGVAPIGATNMGSLGLNCQAPTPLPSSRYLQLYCEGNELRIRTPHPPTPIATITAVPTMMPTTAPTTAPTIVPTLVPTIAPTTVPTVVATLVPTAAPTSAPTHIPTAAPTHVPTSVPTTAPTLVATAAPTVVATTVPTTMPQAGVAELPRVFVDTAAPVVGRVIQVAAGDDLQIALNNAVRGDTLELAAGATYTGNFLLPAKAGAGWIWLRTANYGSLPAPGTRVSPNNAGLMAKIITTNTNPAIAFAEGAGFYRFSGLEITTTWAATTATQYGIVWLGVSLSTGTNMTTLAALPTDVVFDRCYIHGTPTGNVRRGIAMNSANTAVIDSYISDFHETGSDSQALVAWNGPGPFKIVNNYLEGSGENVMFGGADPRIANLVPSDIEFRRNHVAKPAAWQTASPAWSVKNLFELKNARRVLVDGNVFERNWASGQPGFAIVLTVRNQDGSAPWSTVEDVAFTNNIVRQTSQGVSVLGYDGTFTSGSQRASRLLLENNLFDAVGVPPWGGGGMFLQVLSGPIDLMVRRNTVNSRGVTVLFDGMPAQRFVFSNNIAAANTYVVFGSGSSVGNATLAQYAPGAVFVGNVLYGPWPTSVGATPAMFSNYPGNDFPANLGVIGFVDPVGGNFRLSPGSPYQGKGADFDAVIAATAGVAQ